MEYVNSKHSHQHSPTFLPTPPESVNTADVQEFVANGETDCIGDINYEACAEAVYKCRFNYWDIVTYYQLMSSQLVSGTACRIRKVGAL